MHRFLTVLALVLLLAGTWWLWNARESDEGAEQNGNTTVSESTNVKKTKPNVAKRKTKGVKRKTKAIVETQEKPIEVEVVADENGVFLSSIGEKQVNQQITDKAVAMLDMKNGILKFWEIHPDSNQLKFKSVNLVEFLIQSEGESNE